MNEAAQRETISADGAAGSGLFLNAAILDFGDVSIDVDVLPRPSDIRKLRRKHRTTHVLRAERDELLAVPIVTDAPRLSNTSRNISLRENPDLACHLWREAWLRRMVARERSLVRGVPVQVLSIAASDQLGPGTAWEGKSTHPTLLRAIDPRVAYGFAAQVLRPPCTRSRPRAASTTSRNAPCRSSKGSPVKGATSASWSWSGPKMMWQPSPLRSATTTTTIRHRG